MLGLTKPVITERNALRINPAKTCQPIGAMYAALGIHSCMPHSHGSQGCCSYHRSHLTRHFKEPVAATTSSFTEGASVFGGMANLQQALVNIFSIYDPEVVAVHTTCLSEVIGDDIPTIIKKSIEEKKISEETNLPVIPVESPGFSGTKKDGYRAACDALYQLVGTGDTSGITKHSINLLGEFNIAGETYMMKDYFKRLGIEVVSCITGDGRVDELRRCHGAKLNLVQCSGSMLHLAKRLEADYGIPFQRISFFGIEDTAAALYEAAGVFGDPELEKRARILVSMELARIQPELRRFRKILKNKKAAIYVGGAFKAFSLVRALRTLGMKTALVGSQTGNPQDYQQLRELCDPGTIIVDDSNPLELAKFCLEQDVDLFIGGVKERPIAYKLGIGFCDHNHERKEALAGFEGMLNFAKEVHASVMSPVWKFVPRRAKRRTANKKEAA